ncbi:PilZ domain-containing protein [Paractinoplanes atraurantiacus]|uniref:PilZ domain-containing protein n=1 Tax=Paractinoplanes atraurantiacus TaxID=1036182 RepID=A0A285HU33_9ACTN|nr:PilZ domain-containing protein [Actinoplanes atraurantiacus]SNY39177.1 PilZ domain-containing protein [Actinoplanes atraurantiacus]
MIASASTTTEMPAVGTPMFLALGGGANARSRLVAADGDTFTVTAPLEVAGQTAGIPDGQFDVFWASPRSRIVLPSRVVAVSGEAPHRWTLTAAAPAHHSNRREYVRGGGGAAVHLTADDHEMQAALLDISEGGLRCWIDEPAPLTPGAHLHAAMNLPGAHSLTVNGTILTVRNAPHGDPGQHIVLTFTTEEQTAQTIRSYVMTWEINERRRSTYS